MLEFACPHCGKKLKAPTKMAGKKVKCPGCAKVATAPAEPTAATDSLQRDLAIDAICEQFEAACRDGARPKIDDYLNRVSAAQRPQLREELEALQISEDEYTTQPPKLPQEQAITGSSHEDDTGELETSEDQSHDFLRPAQKPGELGRLGPYRILQVLGQGGMGRVYLADDPHLRRQVALKVMLPKYAADAKARHRFLREARAVAAIEHDHILVIHQVAEDNGVPYLAMPLLKGETLATRLKRGDRPSIDEVLRIGREMAEGLAAAHERNLIHRDIKPGNVWLETRSSGQGSMASSQPEENPQSFLATSHSPLATARVKILDFGLARSGSAGGGANTELTSAGMMIGTPAYMSPEQAAGETVDARTDLFSLGVVLYQMCTGQLPYQGANALAILTSLALNEPKPPALLNREVPAELNDLILKLQSKKREDRPATAAAVADTLRAIENKRREDALYAAGADRRRRVRWLVMAGTLAVCALLAFFFGSTIVRVLTNRGELVVEIDDPQVELVVRQNDVIVHDKTMKRSFVLSAGDGEVDVYETNGVKLTTRKFTLTRGGQKTVTVEVAPARAKAPIHIPGLPPLPPQAVAEAAFGKALLHHHSNEPMLAFDSLMEAVPDPAKATWLTDQHKAKILDMTRGFLAHLSRGPEAAAQSVNKIDSKNLPRCVNGLPIALALENGKDAALRLECRVYRALALVQSRSPEGEKVLGDLLDDGAVHPDLRQRYAPATRVLLLAREKHSDDKALLAAELALGYDVFLRAKRLPEWLKQVEAHAKQAGESVKEVWSKQAVATRTAINRPPVNPNTNAAVAVPVERFTFDPAEAKPYQQAAAQELGVPIEVPNSIGIKMVLIPAKTVMKDVAHFYMGMHEVTQEQYEKLMGRNPSHKKGSNHPVENVTWYDAVTFCNVLSEREKLPPYYEIDNITKGTGIPADPKNG